MITGSYPPEVCGVGDYTACVMNTSTAKNWILYKSRKWGILTLFKKIREINKIKPAKIFMQYPTEGYGWSLVPHFLTIYYSLFSNVKCCVVVHEHSQLSFKARVAESLIMLSTNKIIFTNHFELKYAVKLYPRLKMRSKVVKIFSNIEGSIPIKATVDREYDLVNFGHIRPLKGIEVFLDAVQVLRELRPLIRPLLIGQVPSGYEDYFRVIEARCNDIGVEIALNVEMNEVTKLLNNCKVAYLPFQDGVSERRGSFLASISNGVVVCSTAGIFTTNEMKKAVVITETKNDAAIISEILNSSAAQFASYQINNINFLSNEMPKSWDDIAQQYIK